MLVLGMLSLRTWQLWSELLYKETTYILLLSVPSWFILKQSQFNYRMENDDIILISWYHQSEFQPQLH